MPYRVLWAPNAEERLEHFVRSDPDPGILASAAREIDRRLVAAPNAFGESRYELIRIGFVFPFGVQFEVMDDVRTAIVHDVWRIDQK